MEKIPMFCIVFTQITTYDFSVSDDCANDPKNIVVM